MDKRKLYPMALALLAAGFFGASAPLAKVMLGQVDPVMLAGLLYLGSGGGLLAGWVLSRLFPRQRESTEAGLSRRDLPWLAGATIAGGVAAPILLLISLRSTPAATASLLLNFEGAATTCIAALAFAEAVSRRAWISIVIVTLGGIFLTLDMQSAWGISPGAIGIIAACILWGLDNNFTRNISAKDPQVIVMIKGLGAGAFSFLLGWLNGRQLPGPVEILGCLLLGFVCYGLSTLLYVLALRSLGAARTSALYSIAPVVGVVVSFALFREAILPLFWLALPLMVLGAYLLVIESHAHAHAHQEEHHNHAHQHDDLHHEHAHAETGGTEQSHAHLHEHSPDSHDHDHLPDTHHRHLHSPD